MRARCIECCVVLKYAKLLCWGEIIATCDKVSMKANETIYENQ